MAMAIEITFPESLGLHRVRNFAEELSSALGDLGNLPMEQADSAITRVIVSDIPKREFGRCRQLIERILAKHLMSEEATITQAH